MGKTKRSKKKKGTSEHNENCTCKFLTAVESKLQSCIYKNSKCPSQKVIFSCKEEKKKAVYHVNTNELACLFVVDPQHEGSCKLQNNHCLNCKNTCDFILVSCVKEENEEKKFAAFVELKGNKVNDAVKQIKETIKAFKSLFLKHNWKYKIFAAIAISGSAPTNLKDPELKNLVDNYPIPIRRGEINLTYLKEKA